MPPSLIADQSTAKQLASDNHDCQSHDLNKNQLNDLELLLHGNYHPLDRYLHEQDYLSVLENFQLQDGSPWSKLLALEVDKSLHEKIKMGEKVSLLDPEGVLIAYINIDSIFINDERYFLGGKVIGIEPPSHSGKSSLRLYQNPDSLEFDTMFLCSNVLHKSEIDYLKEHFQQTKKRILIQIFFNESYRCYVKLRCITAALSNLPENSFELSLIPEAYSSNIRVVLNQIIIAKNWGIKTFLTNFDQSIPSFDVGVQTIQIPPGNTNDTFESVLSELKYIEAPNSKKGITLFFTGLSGSGKSTIAKKLQSLLHDKSRRRVTLLDGDIIRKNLCSGLGFSKEDRLTNLRRISYVAKEICKHGGMVICAPIAPYESIRDEIRNSIEQDSIFILVHVSTSLEECEKRDRKGLYAKARNGIIKEFTGISDPYEIPTNAEININTVGRTVNECCDDVLNYLEENNYVKM